MGRIIVFGRFPPPFGGNAKHTSDLARSLEEAGVDVERKRFVDGFTPGSADVERSVVSVVRHFRSLRKADTVFDSSTFVFEYIEGYARFAFVALKMLRRFRWIKRLHDESALDRYAGYTRLQKAFFRFALRRVDVLVLDNDAARERWRPVAGPRLRIEVVTPLLPPSPEVFSPALRHGRPVSDGRRRRIVSIGPFIDRYSFRELSDVVDRMRGDGRDLELVLIETGFARDEAFAERVLRGRDWITVLRGLSDRELADEMRRADVFVRGLKDDSFGIARIEALWAGTPVVGTDGPGAETRGNFAFEPGNEDDLERQLEAALDGADPAEIERWACLFEDEAKANRDRLLALASAQ